MEKKQLAVVVAVVGMFCSAALAGGPLGPPMSIREHGEWAFDAGYMYEEMDVYGAGKYSEREREWYEDEEEEEWVPGDWETFGCGYDRRIRLIDLETNTWLASLEYGLCDNWDIYVRAGIADAKGDIAWREVEEEDEEPYEEYCVLEGGSVDFDYGFAWQVGAAFTICRSGPWTFGGRMQFGAAYPDSFNYSGSEVDEELVDEWTEDGVTYQEYDDYSERWRGSIDLDWWQTIAYLGATYQVDPALQLYAGGGWQTLHGTLDHSDAETEYYTGSRLLADGELVDSYEPEDPIPEEGESSSGSYKLKHASAIGVVGLLWAPTDNTRVGVECLVGEAGKWGIGVMAVFATP